MKLSTKKIIGIVGASAIMLALATIFTKGVITSYLSVAIIAGAIGTSFILLGWAKPKSFQAKLVATIVILIALLYQILTWVLLGLKLGFVHNVYTWNVQSVLIVFLPMMLLIVGEEVLRGQLLEKGKGSRVAIVGVTAGILLAEVITMLPIYNLGEAQDVFSLVFVLIGPAVIKNILLTYIALAHDYRINIAYRLIMEMPMYLSPILPNTGEYLPAILQIGLLFVLTVTLGGVQSMSLRLGFSQTTRAQKTRTETASERKVKLWAKRLAMGTVTVMMLGYVGLMSGIFKYYLLVIGSGSMMPSIAKGDLALIEKSNDYAGMEVGDVLVYRHEGTVMVHRIVAREELENGQYAFTTRGDANNAEDKWVVTEDDIIGVTKMRIMGMGYPTIWLNELFNGGKA